MKFNSFKGFITIKYNCPCGWKSECGEKAMKMKLKLHKKKCSHKPKSTKLIYTEKILPGYKKKIVGNNKPSKPYALDLTLLMCEKK